MKVGYVTMSWPVASEVFCLRDIRSLQKSGVDTEVFALKPKIFKNKNLINKLDIDDIESSSINIYRYLIGVLISILNIKLLVHVLIFILKSNDGLKNIVKYLFLLPSCFYSFRKIKYNNFDVIHLFWGHYPSLLAFLIINSNLKVKVSMFLGAYDMTNNLNISKLVSFKANYLFTHSRANIQFLKNNGFDYNRFNVIVRGLDLEEMPIVDNNEKEGAIIVTRLIKEKNIDKTIKIIKKLKEDGVSLKLKVVGDGPELESLKRLVFKDDLKEEVEFLGYLTPRQVFQNLLVSKYFLYPSSKSGERLPNAVKEAMYFGVIPIVSETPGINELIDEGKTGFIIKDFSEKNVIDKLRELNRSNNDEMITDAKSKIRNEFDGVENMKKYISIWRL